MNDTELLQLKGWGHQLFALECQRRKTTKDKLYKALKKTLGRNPHFSSMNEEEVHEAISVLLRWLKIKPHTPPNPKSKTQREKILKKELALLNKQVSQEEIRKAIARLPKRKALWWKRLFNWYV